MILNPHMGSSARPSAELSAPRASIPHLVHDSFKVRGWPEGDRAADAMAAIASGATSPPPTAIPHPSAPRESSQPERWRPPWQQRRCQPSTGPRFIYEVRGPIKRATLRGNECAMRTARARAIRPESKIGFEPPFLVFWAVFGPKTRRVPLMLALFYAIFGEI